MHQGNNGIQRETADTLVNEPLMAPIVEDTHSPLTPTTMHKAIPNHLQPYTHQVEFPRRKCRF